VTGSGGALLGVGAFARRTGLSTKALRHYDRIGLFRPAHVDESNYRWYRTDQIPDAVLIADLRAADMSLDDIRRCLLDRAVLPDVLKHHRVRLESRIARVHGQLHTLIHLIEGKPMTKTSFTLDAEDERALAASLFNSTWDLLEQEDRTRADDDRMLHMAHASRFHWGNVGSAANLARGEWMCSRVYAVLQRPEPSAHHAQRVLDICDENDIGDWDRAFAFEALARAAAVGGDADAARAFTEQALTAAEDVTTDEERNLVLADLETIPGQPRFW
jgi:DNA-binding transcriptional MerR regulator